ncbi:hypothetical protein AURDEDRAFT_58562 [Auricularia subglabra TFB-10046 SS5]|nr:hypothetical protein AURDEDRAFT_58562 [Auricularia subglabra TFB-10046 SS5]
MHPSCNAHIINLPVQDFIKARADPDKRGNGHRDEISLVRDVSVKQRSGAMRKIRFHKLATEKGLKPRNLLRDMPVRWSSSSFMLDRAWDLKAIVNKFIFDLKEDEKSQKKKAALTKMLIEDDEWVRIDLDREIFHLADAAQQMFSAESYPTLYNAMPALVSLLAAWKKRRALPKFADIAEALNAAIAKLQKHVSKVRIAALSATPYWVTMVIHPDFKLGKRFHKFWDTLAPDFESKMESIFKERYEKLHKPTTRTTSSQVPQQTNRLLDELSDDDEATGTLGTSSQSSEPWKTEYRAWLDAHHELGKEMTLVRMWGVLATQYPTWASLAADYLAVMGSSVSSERAFSGGGLVVTGQRGSLKGDIVEALQCIKCALRNDLLIHPSPPSSVLEEQLVVEDSDAEDDADQRAGIEWEIEIIDSETDDA